MTKTVCPKVMANEQSREGVVSLWTKRGPIDVDASIAPIVAALNSVGVETKASCSGHGHRPGNIALRDGRELIIARNFGEARMIDSMFSIGGSGEVVADGDALRKLRKGAGMKAVYLAASLGISAEHLSRMENGHKPVTTATMLAARHVCWASLGRA